MAEYAAEYGSKTRQKGRKPADLDQRQPFYCVSKLYTLYGDKAEKFESFCENKLFTNSLNNSLQIN